MIYTLIYSNNVTYTFYYLSANPMNTFSCISIIIYYFKYYQNQVLIMFYKLLILVKHYDFDNLITF